MDLWQGQRIAVVQDCGGHAWVRREPVNHLTRTTMLPVHAMEQLMHVHEEYI